MIATDRAGVPQLRAAQYQCDQVQADGVNIHQINIPSNGSTGTKGPAAEYPTSSVTCALCHAHYREVLASYRDRERGKAEYTRMLVHELRAPVVASKSLSAAMRYVRPEDPQVTQVLGRIESRMDQLLDLVNDILQLNGIKAGLSLGETADCDLVAETRSICGPYLDEATTKGLSMELDLPTCPVTVRMVRQDYQLILSNLLSNAVKYTGDGGIEIALRQVGSWAILEIRDTGIGIPASEIAQLFTEFFRASNARRSQAPGTGLGLAGVKALVERTGGELAFETQENQGSTFTLRLPLHRTQTNLTWALSEAERRVHLKAALGDKLPDVRAA